MHIDLEKQVYSGTCVRRICVPRSKAQNRLACAPLRHEHTAPCGCSYMVPNAFITWFKASGGWFCPRYWYLAARRLPQRQRSPSFHTVCFPQEVRLAPPALPPTLPRPNSSLARFPPAGRAGAGVGGPAGHPPHPVQALPSRGQAHARGTEGRRAGAPGSPHLLEALAGHCMQGGRRALDGRVTRSQPHNLPTHVPSAGG